MPSPQRSLGHSLFKQKFSQKFLCFFVLFCFFVFCVFYFIKISKFALPGVMLIYERTSKDRKKAPIFHKILKKKIGCGWGERPSVCDHLDVKEMSVFNILGALTH